MTNLVNFPGLGIELNVPRVAFTLFGLDVYWYGVIIVSGLVLAVVYAASQCKRFGVDQDRMIDVVIVGLICALVGGRLAYILPSDTMGIADFFDFRGGGIAIYGAIIGAFLGAGVACKLRKVPLLPLFDLAGMGFLIGQGIGRWGNFFNQEAFGTNTTLPWGMISPQTTAYLSYRQAALAAEGIMVDPALPVHPTFLYESLWCALGFLLLFLYRKKRRFNGEIFLFYMIWYGAGRFGIEGLRTDSLMIGSLRMSQVFAATFVLAGLAIWIYARVKTAGKPLLVPEVPDRVYTVKLPDGEKVEVSWPANTRQPSKETLQRLAREKRDGEEGEKKPRAIDTTAEEVAAGAAEADAADEAVEAETSGAKGLATVDADEEAPEDEAVELGAEIDEAGEVAEDPGDE